jgi:hypothetical protein
VSKRPYFLQTPRLGVVRYMFWCVPLHTFGTSSPRERFYRKLLPCPIHGGAPPATGSQKLRPPYRRGSRVDRRPGLWCRSPPLPPRRTRVATTALPFRIRLAPDGEPGVACDEPSSGGSPSPTPLRARTPTTTAPPDVRVRGPQDGFVPAVCGRGCPEEFPSSGTGAATRERPRKVTPEDGAEA